jgi:electron transport complex protein RnfG
VNSVTKQKILVQALAEENSSLKEVVPLAANFEPVMSADEVSYYKATDKDNKFIGVAFKASGKGYSSLIETMVGMSMTGEIIAIKVLSQSETPGLGAKVAENQFCDQFSGKNALGLNGVEAITGATISSKAVINSINSKAEEVLKLIKNG